MPAGERSAFFGPPRDGFQRGGAHVAVHLVPVYDGRLVAFDVDVPGASGRWLPWGVLAFGGNPYEDASALADDWCGGAVSDLRLVDCLSSEREGSWELSLLFRAALTAMPGPGERRRPVALRPPVSESINGFPPAEFDRWTGAGPAARETGSAPAGPRLLF